MYLYYIMPEVATLALLASEYALILAVDKERSFCYSLEYPSIRRMAQKEETGTVAKATKTVQQLLSYHHAHAAWFAATKDLFNRVAAFYFEVITAHSGLLDLSAKAALTALETLTHTTSGNPHPVMPLSGAIAADLPAMFRRAAIQAALGSAHSFHSHLEKWRKQKEKAVGRGKKFTLRPPVPPRGWNKSVTLYTGQWKERTPKSIMLKVW